MSQIKDKSTSHGKALRMLSSWWKRFREKEEFEDLVAPVEPAKDGAYRTVEIIFDEPKYKGLILQEKRPKGYPNWFQLDQIQEIIMVMKDSGIPLHSVSFGSPEKHSPAILFIELKNFPFGITLAPMTFDHEEDDFEEDVI